MHAYVMNGVISLGCHHCNERVSGIHTAFIIVMTKVVVTDASTIVVKIEELTTEATIVVVRGYRLHLNVILLTETLRYINFYLL